MSDILSHQSLYFGARKFAHSAMDAHSRHDEEVFLLHAGVSIERLAKAALSQRSPFLLMEMKGKEDTLLHLAGVQETQKIRTVGAAQALARLRTMGAIPKHDADLDELIELRNGIAHLDASLGGPFDGLTVFVRTSNSLLDQLGHAKDDYWGSWLGIIEITASEALAVVEREVGRRMEQARYRLGSRLHGVPETAVSIIYENANAPQEGVSGYGLRMMCGLYSFQSPQECPACKCTGRLIVNLPIIGTGPAEGAPNRGFHCPLCYFNAAGEDELAACGLQSQEMYLDEQGEPITLKASMFSEFVEIGFLAEGDVAALIEHLYGKV